jgi:hypothetical protein
VTIREIFRITASMSNGARSPNNGDLDFRDRRLRRGSDPRNLQIGNDCPHSSCQPLPRSAASTPRLLLGFLMVGMDTWSAGADLSLRTMAFKFSAIALRRGRVTHGVNLYPVGSDRIWGPKEPIEESTVSLKHPLAG